MLGGRWSLIEPITIPMLMATSLEKDNAIHPRTKVRTSTQPQSKLS